jgi:hypothetical protein
MKHYNEDLGPFITNIVQIISDFGMGITGLNAGGGYFRHEDEWLKKASQSAHKLVVEKPQRFEIQIDEKIYRFALEKDDEFIPMSSVKPSVARMKKIGDTHGIATRHAYTGGNNIVDHIFVVQRNAPIDFPSLRKPKP